MTRSSIVRPHARTRKALTLFVATRAALVLAPLLGLLPCGVAFSSQFAAVLALQSSRPFPTFPWVQPIQSRPELAKGQFLVASRDLNDPNFSETVVLLIDYDWHGARGVVINRPTKVTLSEVFSNLKGMQQRTDTIYIGGPVDRTHMSLLIQSSRPLDEARHVFADVHVSSSQTMLKQVAEGEGETFRVYAGYAGWAPGQLDHEVARGDWRVLPADAGTIFQKTPDKMWPELIRQGSLQWAKMQTKGALWSLSH